MSNIIQYNRTGITDADQTASRTSKDSSINISHNVASVIRLFLAIMVFVVIVLTIAK